MNELAEALGLSKSQLVAKLQRLIAIDTALTSAGVAPEQLGELLEYAQPVFAINQLDATIKALEDKKLEGMIAIDEQIQAHRAQKDALEKDLRSGMA